ncbi:MAG TPA: hypothetical protein VFE35_05340 [Candidatus Cybelea sp.]|jgi:hypothetical protein|nr:hypothetical protein [Candidatus Cybelea sp.]
MKNVVPFKAPETFERLGINWAKEPATEHERSLREAFLDYESCYLPDGLVSVLLLSIVCQRRGSIATDLQAAAEFAEIMLAIKSRKHQDDVMQAIHLCLTERGSADPKDVSFSLREARLRVLPGGADRMLTHSHEPRPAQSTED